MALTAKALVLITAYQYGAVDGEKLRVFLDDFFFPEAKRRLVVNAVFNNNINTLLHNYIIRQFINSVPGLGKLVENYTGNGPGDDRNDAEIVEKLFMDVVRAEKNDDLSEKILVADQVIHYQHVTGNFLDEDIEEEYAIAEKIVRKMLRCTL